MRKPFEWAGRSSRPSKWVGRSQAGVRTRFMGAEPVEFRAWPVRAALGWLPRVLSS